MKSQVPVVDLDSIMSYVSRFENSFQESSRALAVVRTGETPNEGAIFITEVNSLSVVIEVWVTGKCDIMISDRNRGFDDLVCFSYIHSQADLEPLLDDVLLLALVFPFDTVVSVIGQRWPSNAEIDLARFARYSES